MHDDAQRDPRAPPMLRTVRTAEDPPVSPRTRAAAGDGASLARSSTTRSDQHSQFSPVYRRRADSRANTFRAVDDYDEVAFDFESSRPGWQPGSEPGFDPSKPDGGHASVPVLQADCDITIFDFSEIRVDQRTYGNADFIRFLDEPQPAWSKCRWINVNGLSWDVIQALGKNKGLHTLAIEDVMNTRNRTKADWYTDQAFILLTLQKLVRLVDPDTSDSESSSDSDDEDGWCAPLRRTMTRPQLSKRDRLRTRLGLRPKDPIKLPDDALLVRTLQRYHASPNEARTEYMERHSSLNSRNLAVSAEQVSIFLTSDNTVISFFELSASDIERPIALRLGTPGTILRQSCDASLLVQAIIDAIIDLALPLTAVYSDVIGDLELDVLMSPSMKQSRSLYICISEINKMLTFLNPIDNIVNVLRDHATTMHPEVAASQLRNPASGVIVTPLTHTYLGDVLDHCVLITETMQQIKRSADNLINLIFNTISANQNESMKTLTMITIIFLPLTFLTGYFGQNFEPFDDLKRGIDFFWKIAGPLLAGTITIMLHRKIINGVSSFFQRRHVVAIRKRRPKRRKQA
ncbi:hypothetical protein F5X68DRAFT_199680 [Plectosphaerella plurivora]|uniref:Uncharacterized protein n=1 Tax=Plectosphaerella plurivora TaxID=936078 RepID=A0A9P8VL50_9PEZI|nr:hypothetical protein F5X68DRAFT_199680 [Plectosphaerella plurivora]